MKKIDMNIIIFTFVILVVYGLLFIVTGYGIPCPIHKLTGLYCPGCGISRMLLSLVRFDLYQSFRYNPLAFIYLVLFGIYTLVNLFYYIKNKSIIKLNNYVYIFILISLIAFGILRNISEFSYLIPTIVK